MHELGRGLILLGAVLVALGFLLLLAPKLPVLGRLPGDLLLKGKHTTIYLPLATSIIISLVISLILYLVNRSR